MRLPFRAAVIGLLALSLAACAADSSSKLWLALAKFDTATAQGLKVACDNRTKARLLYTAAVISKGKTPSRKVENGFATLDNGCAALAAGADVNGVATAMLLAYVAIKAEVRDVEPLPVGLQRDLESKGAIR